MNGPDRACPLLERAHAERVELIRRAALMSIARADAGQAVDPEHLTWAQRFVAFNPPLQGPLSSGEPEAA